MTISQRIGLFVLLALAAVAAVHWRSGTGQPTDKPDRFPEVVLSTDVRSSPNFVSVVVDPLGGESNYSPEWFKNTLEFARGQGVTDRRDVGLGFELTGVGSNGFSIEHLTYYLADLKRSKIIGVHRVAEPVEAPVLPPLNFRWEPFVRSTED